MSSAMMELPAAKTVEPSDVNRPRVLVVAPEPFYEDRGTPIALQHVLKSFAQLGYQIDLLTYPIGNSPAFDHVRYIRAANPLKLKHVCIGFSFRKLILDLSLFFKLRKLLRNEKYAFIHAIEESAFLVTLLIRKQQTPMLYDMQSNMAEQLCSHRWLKLGPLPRVWHACQRWLIRRSTLVACSQGLEDYIQQSAPATPIHKWFYPNQSVEIDPQLVKNLRRGLCIADEQPVIVYTGNGAGYQGLDLLMQAMPGVIERFPDAMFLMVGVDLQCQMQLQKKLSALVKQASFRLIPRQPQRSIPAYLQIADVLVSPRTFGENLPLKVIEYLAAGRPIVATDIKAHHCMLTTQTAVLTPPTATAFAEGIVSLLADPRRGAQLADQGLAYYRDHLDWQHFYRSTEQAIHRLLGRVQPPPDTSMTIDTKSHRPTVSVVIPVRDAEDSVGRLVTTIFAQRSADQSLEVLVVNDGSTDRTAAVASAAGARVIDVPDSTGNPARARNLGAREAVGQFLIFLDVDCVPEPGWLEAILTSHDTGWRCVGGALSMPGGLSLMSRLDYYCGWYHSHEKQAAHHTAQHPPCNLGIERALFLETSGFTETQPIAYAHEELAWQHELHVRGVQILFQPAARVGHHNRKGLGNVLRRSYRWAYSAVESKRGTGITRWGWLHRSPLLAALIAIPLIPVHAAYIVACWIRVGVWEPLWLSPMVLLVRTVYGLGMCVGTLRYMAVNDPAAERRPRWE